jgi:NAD(P)-dependent dehydrogenase (short-subunit alcohol dehydrogenase family)
MTAQDDTEVPDYLARLRVDERSFVVLGAGMGMGRQTVHALAQAGARHVMCVDIEESRANEVAAEIGCGIPWWGDITSREAMRRLASHASQTMGRVDGFVDIVGIAAWAGIFDIDDATWDQQFDICLRHAYMASQELGRSIVDGGGGTMVFIASVSGLSGAPMHAAYGAAKAGLMAWVQSLAVELGPMGVRANAIAPGTILTPRVTPLLNDEQLAAHAARTPLKRMGDPSDIAGAALFLSSDLSSYVSGRTLVVDGGLGSTFRYGSL